MPTTRPRIVLHLELSCQEPSGADLIAFLRKAVPFYEMLPGVKIRLLRSIDRPGRFIEVVEYETDDAFESDRARVSGDERMARFLSQWRELLAEVPGVEHYADVTSEITR